jgi:ATP-dependent Clp protease ATP-binding subunit ClpB
MSAELTQIVAEHFRPEFVNRIDEIVVFNNLEKSQIKSILWQWLLSWISDRQKT